MPRYAKRHQSSAWYLRAHTHTYIDTHRTTASMRTFPTKCEQRRLYVVTVPRAEGSERARPWETSRLLIRHFSGSDSRDPPAAAHRHRSNAARDHCFRIMSRENIPRLALFCFYFISFFFFFFHFYFIISFRVRRVTAANSLPSRHRAVASSEARPAQDRECVIRTPRLGLQLASRHDRNTKRALITGVTRPPKWTHGWLSGDSRNMKPFPWIDGTAVGTVAR